MSAPLRSRNAPLITLGAIVSLLACTNARGQAAPEGFHAIPGMPFDISVYAGLYAPFGSMFDCGGQPCGYANGGSPVPPGQTVGLQKTIAVGSHLTVWPAKRFGIEATLAYAPSGVTMACRVPDCNAGHAITASARVVVPVVGVTSPRSFYLGAGVGYVALGGNAYNGVTGTTTTSPTVGAGLELKSASGPSVRIEAEVFLLRPRFRLESCDASDGICRVLPPSNGWTQRSQPVVILSVGWAFGGGGSRSQR